VKRALLVVVAAAFLVAGCGGDDNETTPTETATVATPVYFLRDGKVWPVARKVGVSGNFTTALADALAAGPTKEEQTQMGLGTEVPPDSDGTNLSDAALAQWVFTMTLRTPPDVVMSVDVGGRTYTRADFEDQTPLILVERPLPFATVETPLAVTGTANTFEATFEYELVDSAGKVVDTNFVTATSGTGTRGTFAFKTKKVGDVAALRVFERSAQDGSRIHEAEIPLRMSQ
jgi:hypothetical protein